MEWHQPQSDMFHQTEAQYQSFLHFRKLIVHFNFN